MNTNWKIIEYILKSIIIGIVIVFSYDKKYTGVWLFLVLFGMITFSIITNSFIHNIRRKIK